jgi:hypothetical protein
VQQVHADADGSKRNVGNLHAVLVPPSCHAVLEGDTTFPRAVGDRTAFDAATIPEFAGVNMQRQVERLEVVMDLCPGNDQVAGHDCPQAVPI